VQALAVQGRFAVNTLHAQEIRSYQITPDGQYATLAVEESWSTRRFDARTRECVHALPQHRIAQKVLLMRSATQSWRIYSLELEPGIEPVELACP
jgi:LPS sulfotransferase NodH